MAETLSDWLMKAAKTYIGYSDAPKAPPRPPVKKEAEWKPAQPKGLWETLAEGFDDTVEHYSPAAWLARKGASSVPLNRDFDPTGANAGLSFEERNQRALDRTRATVTKKEREFRQRRAAEQLDNPDTNAQKVARFAGSIPGGLVSDPTSIIAPGSSLLAKVGSQAAVSGLTDAGMQGLEMQEGVRDEFSPEEALFSAAAGGVLPAVGHGLGKLANSVRGEPGVDAPAISSPSHFVDRLNNEGLDFANSPDGSEYFVRNAPAIREELDKRTQGAGAEPQPEIDRRVAAADDYFGPERRAGKIGTDETLEFPQSGKTADITVYAEDELRQRLKDSGIDPASIGMEPRKAANDTVANDTHIDDTIEALDNLSDERGGLTPGQDALQERLQAEERVANDNPRYQIDRSSPEYQAYRARKAANDTPSAFSEPQIEHSGASKSAVPPHMLPMADDTGVHGPTDLGFDPDLAKAQRDRLAAAEMKDAPKYVGSVNMENLDLSPEAELAARTLAESAGVGKRRRSREDTQAAADELEMNDIRSIGDISAKLKAGKDTVASLANDIVETARTHGVGSPEHNKVLADFVRKYGIHSKNAGETGRALNILKNDAVDSQGRATDPEAVKRIGEIASDPEKADKLNDLIEKHKDDPEALKKIAKALTEKKAEDYIFSTWFNMVLSGPLTHARNIIGNTANLVNDLGTHGVASVLGQRKKWSDNTDRVMGREVAARIYGAALGVKQGFLNMPLAFKEGVPLDLVNRVESPTAYSGKKSYVLEGPTRALAAEDEFFRAVAHMSELYGSAVRKSIQESDDGKINWDRVDELIKDPTPPMLDRAADYAQVMRFQDKPGILAEQVAKLTHPKPDDTKPQRIVRAALRLNIPFIRTPSSIIRTALRNSPLGVFESRNIAGWKKGGADRDLAIARVAVGTAVTAQIVNWVNDGNISGDGPSDYRRSAEKQASGWRPRSIKIGDTWYSYDNLGPVSAVLGGTANMVEKYNEGKMKGDDFLDASGKMSVGLADALMNNGWTESVANLFKVVSGPETQRKSAFDNWVAGQAASMTVPALVRQVNQTYVDNVTRDTSGNKTLSDRVTGRIKAGIPGLSDNLPAKHDVYGNVVDREGAVGPDIINPLTMSTEEKGTTEAELARLANDDPAGKTLVGPNPTSIKGIGKLNASDYQKYQGMTGAYLKDGMKDLIADPSWKTLSDDEKRGLVSSVLKDARKSARQQLVDGFETEKAPAPTPTPTPEETGNVFPGIPTSMGRTVRGNKAVHGASNSDHLRGDGIDFRPPPGMSMAELHRQAVEFFPEARYIENEGNHVHVSIPGLHAPLYGKKGSQ